MGNALKSLFGKKQTRVLMLGLDNAGKTTVLHKIKDGSDYESVPTVGFSVETVKMRNITLNVWDVGGQDKIRPLWRHYYTGTDALIFIVDSSDLGRMEEAKKEFLRIVTDNEMQDVVVLIFANKQDLPKAASEEEVGDLLDIQRLEGRSCVVKASCAKTGAGLEEGMAWLAEEVLQRRKQKGKLKPKGKGREKDDEKETRKGKEKENSHEEDTEDREEQEREKKKIGNGNVEKETEE